jgi:hypothetical protein
MPLMALLLVGTIILGIAYLSLYFSYDRFTSPAFAKEFGFAFKVNEKFDDNQVEKLRKRGIWIEWGRAAIFVYPAIILFHSADPFIR